MLFSFRIFFSGSFWPNMTHFPGCFRKFVVLLYFCFPYKYICYTKQIRITVGKLSNFADFKVCHSMVIYKGFSKIGLNAMARCVACEMKDLRVN